MRIFDNEERRSQFLEEFKKVDKFYNTFKEEFEAEIITIIRLHYPEFVRTEEFDELLNQFAIAALSITHTVLDKDESYPDFRKTEDLAALRAYYAKAIQTTKNKELAEQTAGETSEAIRARVDRAREFARRARTMNRSGASPMYVKG